MALTLSRMLDLGTPAPHFELPDPLGETVSYAGTMREKAAKLVMFICNHCPYVVHLKEGISQLAQDYYGREVGIVAINSNDVDKYPADSPEKMKADIDQYGYVFPYLYDETQEVARSFQAACTPDFYLFDGEDRLVYRGQFDDSRPGSETPVTGSEIRSAIEALLAGKKVQPDQKPSMGCNIKWREVAEQPTP